MTFSLTRQTVVCKSIRPLVQRYQHHKQLSTVSNKNETSTIFWTLLCSVHCVNQLTETRGAQGRLPQFCQRFFPKLIQIRRVFTGVRCPLTWLTSLQNTKFAVSVGHPKGERFSASGALSLDPAGGLRSTLLICPSHIFDLAMPLRGLERGA